VRWDLLQAMTPAKRQAQRGIVPLLDPNAPTGVARQPVSALKIWWALQNSFIPRAASVVDSDGFQDVKSQDLRVAVHTLRWGFRADVRKHSTGFGINCSAN